MPEVFGDCMYMQGQIIEQKMRSKMDINNKEQTMNKIVPLGTLLLPMAIKIYLPT
jgi:hypothetical protein